MTPSPPTDPYKTIGDILLTLCRYGPQTDRQLTTRLVEQIGKRPGTVKQRRCQALNRGLLHSVDCSDHQPRGRLARRWTPTRAGFGLIQERIIGEIFGKHMPTGSIERHAAGWVLLDDKGEPVDAKYDPIEAR